MRRSSMDAGSNVKVICRFRPLIDIELELEGNQSINYSFPSEDTVVTNSGERFTFDKVFSMSAQQNEIFDFIGRPIVEDVLTGYNGTAIAYGQTGSGKSFSMMGDDIYSNKMQGIIPRAINLIFDSVEKTGSDAEFTIKCSMLEIYKEKLKDLCGYGSELRIKESRQRGIYVEGLTEIYVINEEEVLGILSMGERNRTVASTKMNKVSSRSHQLFMLEVKQKFPNDSEKRGILNLVDLAGSEKLHRTGVTGNKLEEAKKINLSLSALGNVIKSLTSNNEHIPYRDSKLTRLLQESLGGNYKTTLLVCCSPHTRNTEDTLNSLKFAKRAKRIKNRVHVNIKRSVEEYIKIIEELKLQLIKAKDEIGYWKDRSGVRDRFAHRLTVISEKPLKIFNVPEITAEDAADPFTLASDISGDVSDNNSGRNNEEFLRVENENQELKLKIEEMAKTLTQESKKRVQTEKKYYEISEKYHKLLITANENDSKQEYMAAENSNLNSQIDSLKAHIRILNSKFNKILEKMKNNEKITEWEFADTISDVENSLPVYTQEASLTVQDEMNESFIGITTDPEMLIEQDCYAHEMHLALEESSQMNQDIVIFELKKQIINSGIVNCELMRNYCDIKLRVNLLSEKFNLKVKLSKFQEGKIQLYENMLNKLQESYDKLIRLMGKYEENNKRVYFHDMKKAKIARPIRRAGIESCENFLSRTRTIGHCEGCHNPSIRRQNTMQNPFGKSIKFKSIESGYQLQALYNQQLKEELELTRNERNTYKSLYSSFQTQQMDVYTNEKARWRKYLEEFRENCNKELVRKQHEINKLNIQIAHWMNLYVEIQNKSKNSDVRRVVERKKNYSNAETSLSEKAMKVQLLNSPLHSFKKMSKLSILNSKRGDISPPIFDE